MTSPVCVTLAVGRLECALRLARDCAARADRFELRLDALDPGEVASGAWTAVPEPGRWVATWRSPAEGGRGRERPAGLLARAVAAGFGAVDVEERDLESGHGEAAAVPVERRWVSRHAATAPRDGAEARAWTDRLRAHPAALHKLVLPGETWSAARLALDARAAVPPGEPFTVFAQGEVGHATRVLGAMAGNAVTFAAPAGEEPAAPGQPDVVQLHDEYRWSALGPGTRVYGVIGASVAHSRSPAMHNAGFASAGLDAVYLPLAAPDPGALFEDVRAGRFAGASVTAPYKADAARAADTRDDGVDRVGAANTLVRRDGALHGVNTDVLAAGILLRRLGAGPGAPVAVLGGGGAAAAVVDAARALGAPARCHLRDPGRAASSLSGAAAPWDAFRPGDAAVVVNATPLGQEGRLPVDVESLDWAGTAVLDLVYAAGGSGFSRLAAARGLRHEDGLTFLAVQGAEQFRLWTGIEADPAAFREAAA